ncbi:hypothetical protein B2J68_18665 [Vibrio cholerae]|uniref:hypothetical protein n=1 Tax=Vibrio cholerae TaxID=666 RepID=UPI000B647E7E|nr:hypothetical protein [Vibrio cholerae]OWO68931.1 hypothetical protein B2J68_18665 [Vibrio cholerae]
MQTSSIVFIVKTSSGDRFFCGFGKNNSVLTSLTLSGAKLFMPNLPSKIKEISETLKQKKKSFRLHFVALDPEPIPACLDNL